AVAGDDAALDLRQAEGRVVRGDANVSCEQHLDTAAHAEAVHRRDNRLPDLEAAIEQLVLLRQPDLRPWILRGQDVLDIGAGAEGLVAGPGQDGATDLWIVAHRLPGLRDR